MGTKPWSALLDPLAVIVKRDERQRRELTGIDELAASIARRGQLQPIVVQRGTNVLIAGERRLTAIRQLQKTPGLAQIQVKVVYSDEVDPGELQALELEENVKRVDLSWQDNCLAIWSYHNHRETSDPEWSQAKTAEALGFSVGTISERLAVAEEIKAGNKMVAEAPKLSTAKGIVQRTSERREAAETSQLLSLVARPIKASPAGTPQAESEAVDLAPEASGHILNANFNEWALTYSGPKFNLIHCDFPYGVGMHKSDQGSGDAYGTYEDTPDVYFQLLANFMGNLDRFTEDSAHLVFWFSMDYYELTRQVLGGTVRQLGPLSWEPSGAAWRVNPFPLIWHKSDGSGIIPDANRGPRRTYETAFLASRGDRKIVRAVTNSIDSPIQRGRHMSEKPQKVLGHFFRMLVDSHTSLLDPTCGSGSAIRAAFTAKAGRYLGLELNPEFARDADEVFREHMEADSINIEELLSDDEKVDA